MKDYLPLIEEALDRYSDAFDLPPLFLRSMRYSLLSGGKRIRACLCLASGASQATIKPSAKETPSWPGTGF